MVSARSLEVLRVIVSDYVANREPVGSKSIAQRHGFGVSSATIRNDMAQLEEAELIEAPHTSSGRVPTDKGYRVFVDHLAEHRPMSAAQRRAIHSFLAGANDLDEVLVRSVRTLARLTSSVAIAQYPSLVQASIRHVEFVRLGERRILTVLVTDSGRVEQRVAEAAAPVSEELLLTVRERFGARMVDRTVPEAIESLRDLSEVLPPEDAELVAPVVANLIEQLAANRRDRVVVAGAANLARSEADFPSSILPVLEAIEEQVVLLRLLGEVDGGEGVEVRIGRENAQSELSETSVLSTDYQADGGTARLGVLGPTRMDYSGNMAAVRAVARYLSRALDDGRAG